ncbi:MAG: hypothetical protein Q7T13_01560 [Polaromonas sp.]|nr:hypothetical protein [Polaromonas sp.]
MNHFFLSADDAEEARKERLARAHLPALLRYNTGHKDRYVFDIRREYKHPDEATSDLKEYAAAVRARIKGMN